jgi:hypothetical protein
MRDRTYSLVLSILLEALISSALLAAQTQAKSIAQQPQQSIIVVPENVAVIVRPLLDLRQESMKQCGAPGTPSKCLDGQAYTQERAREEKFNLLLERLVTQQGPSVDEGLVILMWFYIGESGEEIDSVISRGRRTLPYLKKYRNSRPVIPNRVYPDSMLKELGARQEHFKAAMLAIK